MRTLPVDRSDCTTDNAAKLQQTCGPDNEQCKIDPEETLRSFKWLITYEVARSDSAEGNADSKRRFTVGVGIRIAHNAESARGISPRAAHRTGRKPLDLSGSRHRTKAAAFH